MRRAKIDQISFSDLRTLDKSMSHLEKLEINSQDTHQYQFTES